MQTRLKLLGLSALVARLLRQMRHQAPRWSRRMRNEMPRLALLAFIGSLFHSPTIASDLKDLACKAAPDAYYHPKAIRLHESGSVLVEYSVSRKGKTQRVVVLQSTASESLNESAILYVTNMRCKPSEEWIKGGGPKKRLRLNVLFQFTNEEPSKSIDPAADWVKITAPAI